MSTRLQWRAHGEHGVAIERRERAEIEHARLNPVGREALGHAERGVDVGAVRNDHEVIPVAPERGAADRQSAAGGSGASTCLIRGSR